jgi:hypothetical protein
MAWFEDLQPWTYFSVEADRPLLAVGWLERGRPYATGDTDEDTRAALRILYCHDASRMQPKYATACVYFGGSHPCDFCDKGRRGPRGYGNLFVPAEREIFVCNDLIRHYVEEHNYLPPRRFIEALLKDPPPVVLNPGGLEWERAQLKALRAEA